MFAAKKKKSSKKNKSNQKNKQQNNQSNQVKVYNASNKVDDIKVDNTAPTKVVEAIRIKDADVEISTLKNDIVEDVSGLQAAIVETQIQAREEKAAMEAEIDKEIANEEFLLTLTINTPFTPNTVKGVQFKKPYFEFSVILH